MEREIKETFYKEEEEKREEIITHGAMGRRGNLETANRKERC